MGKPIIRAVAYVSPPYINPCFMYYGTVKTEKCSKAGVEIGLHYEQLTRLGFKVDFIKADNETDMVDLLKRGHADISANAYDITKSYDNKTLSFTMPVATDKLLLIIRSPNTYHVPKLLFYKWDWMIWLFCLLTFALVYCYKKGIQYWLKKRYKNLTFTNAIYSCPMICWLIAFSIVLSVYTQYLTLALYTRTSVLPFYDRKTLYKQLKAGNCRFIIHEFNKDSALKMFPFLTDSPEELKTFDNALNKSAIFIGKYDQFEFIRKIKEQSCNIGLVNFLASKILLHRTNGLTVIDLLELPMSTYANLYRKCFRFKEYLQFINVGSMTTAYDNYLKQHLQFQYDLNEPDYQVGQNDKALHLYQVLHTFYFLLFGLLMSSLIFIILLLWKTCHK